MVVGLHICRFPQNQLRSQTFQAAVLITPLTQQTQQHVSPKQIL
jgi:hypothetical protein